MIYCEHVNILLIAFHISQPSFDKVVPPSFMELGIAELVAIYSELCELGSPPPVIDADDLQRDPQVNLLLVVRMVLSLCG
jgi:hypothetical protein